MDERLTEMSDLQYQIGTMYLQDKSRKDHRYRGSGAKAMQPHMVWRRSDIAQAGIAGGCLAAMKEGR